jgi:steroid 5-alpha reductase family enzyme
MVTYFIRLLVTTFVFLKRKLPWAEAIIISSLMSLALYGFAKVGGSNQQPVGLIELVGMLLYVIGSHLNTNSEYTRHIWKKNPDNKVRLYTEGLFRYSMHVNYFGDTVLFTGFALITHSLIMLVIPLLMTVNFVLFIIPTLDKYLAEKYGTDFQEYARRTKKFIPWVY